MTLTAEGETPSDRLGTCSTTTAGGPCGLPLPCAWHPAGRDQWVENRSLLEQQHEMRDLCMREVEVTMITADGPGSWLGLPPSKVLCLRPTPCDNPNHKADEWGQR